MNVKRCFANDKYEIGLMQPMLLEVNASSTPATHSCFRPQLRL